MASLVASYNGINVLITVVPEMVANAKTCATHISDPKAASKWRDANKAVSMFS